MTLDDGHVQPRSIAPTSISVRNILPFSMSNTSVAFPSLQDVGLWFFQSANPGGNPQQQWQASQQLQECVNRAKQAEHYRAPFASTCFQLFADDQRSMEIRFAALSTLSRLTLNELERRQLRSYLLFQSGDEQRKESRPPAFLRNKAALILMQHVLLDVPDRWSTFIQDMSRLAQTCPELFLKTIDTLLEDFLMNETDKDSIRRVKDILKGYPDVSQEPIDHQQQERQSYSNKTSKSTPLEKLFGITVQLLGMSLSCSAQAMNGENRYFVDLQVLALNTIKGFFMWTELSFLGTENANRALELLLLSLQPNRAVASVQLAALSAWGEWTTSASMHKKNNRNDKDKSSISSFNDPKLPVMLAVLERLHEYNLLPYTGESDFDIEVVIEVSKLITLFGLEVEPLREKASGLMASQQRPNNGEGGDQYLSIISLFNKVLDMFFRGLAYDDIDVSGAVLPLATRLAQSMQEESPENKSMGIRQYIPQILNILYRQLKYPEDFSYDFDEEDNAEEEQYRIELSKFFVKLVTVAPDVCLQFVGEAAVQFWGNACTTATLGTAPSPDVEATLRLLFHYAEGIRPAPGVKTVLQNPNFCSILVAIHSSDITVHAHHEVILLYYETAVRYCLFYKQTTNTNNGGTRDDKMLLGKLLESISGPRGLQHPHSKVRSRCSYLFLRLVKNLVSLLRPLVETAVHGISTLLSNTELELRPDDTLYLFEALGLLLGKTGLPPLDQQRYLTMVMTPHVRSIKDVLATTPSASLTPSDVEQHGQSLSFSIAAIAYLSKGLSKEPPEEIQQVLLEVTGIALDVLHAFPMSDAVRNRVMVFLQRMIQSIGDKVLNPIPEFLALLIQHCNSEDILFVSQLFNQLCIKFKANACSAIDAALLPFLRKCQSMAPSTHATTTNATIRSHGESSTLNVQNHSPSSSTVETPPHFLVEKLSIQKLGFSVLHHVAVHKATAILTSSTNASSLEAIFNTVKDGAVVVQDPVIKKTCLRFFRELLIQWSSDAAAPQGYQSGLDVFISQSLIPGVWLSMVDPAFDERDAQQSRIVTEFAYILLSAQRKHGWDVVANLLRGANGRDPSALWLRDGSSSSTALLDDSTESSVKSLEGHLLTALAARRRNSLTS